MLKNTKFSIIVPVYNTSTKYLNECFDSIINQNYDNYELIIVDDGSNKETVSFLDSLNFKKTKVIHQKNSGVIKARINGASKASGNYILFVDSDDFISENCLSHLNDVVIKNNPDVIVYESQRFSGSIDNTINGGHYFNEGIVEKQEILKTLLQLHINAFTDKICKRELLESLVNNIDTSIVNGEDLQQSTYVLLNSNVIYYTDKTIAYYRIYEGERDYYDVTRLHDINYMIPTYRMVFEERSDYSYLLPVYKQYSINSIIYTAFNLVWANKDTKALLNELNDQNIVKIMKNCDAMISFTSQLIFNILTIKFYYVFSLISYIYKLIKF